MHHYNDNEHLCISYKTTISTTTFIFNATAHLFCHTHPPPAYNVCFFVIDMHYTFYNCHYNDTTTSSNLTMKSHTGHPTPTRDTPASQSPQPQDTYRYYY